MDGHTHTSKHHLIRLPFMGSAGNQNPFAPYDNYRDCSQGICSIYCPQYCYLIFPPPPPSDDDPSPPFSPLIIAIIVVLICAFVLASYYTFATRYSRARSDHATGVEAGESHNETGQDPWGSTPASGLDEALIKKITVCKYQRGGGLIEGTECAVCLSEFQENESLRLMPKCSHAFHLPCIDTWLKSQSNCPLCRANVEALVHPSPLPALAPSLNMNPYESRRPEDLVLVVNDQERSCDEHTVRNAAEDSHTVDTDMDQGTSEQLRRSVSLGMVLPQQQLLIVDILKFEDIDEYIKVESDHLWRGTGSSSGNRSRDGELLRSPVATKKLGPGGRFFFGIHDKGKTCALPAV